MRYSFLAVALAAALGATLSLDAAAAESAELAELKAQLAALQEKVAELEARTNAQSDINAGTQQNVESIVATTPKVETKGGIKVTSADGQFEASIGGRLHFDVYAFGRDTVAVIGGSELRRGRLSVVGKALGWDYRLEHDFAAGNQLDGLRDAYLATALWGGKAAIGHFKPFRAMEELTSSNELLMMERPFTSATGVFAGRQFQMGVGYLRATDHHTIGLSVFNLRGGAGPRNEGMGASTRATWAPVNDDHQTLHVGGWASVENANRGSAELKAVVNYAGRRGPIQAIASSGGAEDGQVASWGLEVAGSRGPLFFQGEYVRAAFDQAQGGNHDVVTWYLQGSWLVNGGHRGYKAATGVFASPRVQSQGLWELAARYDSIENRDLAGYAASDVILGVNYYANPNLRFMFNYVMGDDQVNGDQTRQYALRTQFAW